MSFDGLLIISVIAVAAPVLAASVRRMKLPSVVVEIAAGIVVGPSVLAWVRIDQPVTVVALLGLAFLLFLAGLEIDLRATAPSQARQPCPASRASRPPAAPWPYPTGEASWPAPAASCTIPARYYAYHPVLHGSADRGRKRNSRAYRRLHVRVAIAV